MNDVYILAIESSCDETSISIVKNGTVDVVTSTLSQIDAHTSYGGVVPEIASRMHTENFTIVLDDLLSKTDLTLSDMDAIAVTYAPGLLGSLLVGIEVAKTISYVYNKPLIKVNHIAGHIYSNAIGKGMEFPLLALVVSGGHSELVYMSDHYQFKILGSTLDDAAGEVYDKVAKVLNLSYPGGPSIEKTALLGKETFKLPVVMKNDNLDMSFSGLKSAVINYVHNETQRGEKVNVNDVSYTFQNAIVEQIIRKTKMAINKTNVKRIIVAGGVSANKYLRKELEDLASSLEVDISIPEMKYCTDNATMIGAAAYPLYLKKEFAGYDLNGISTGDLYK